MQPLVSLGSLSVVDGVASLTGTVNATAGLDTSAGASGAAGSSVDLTVNAAPVNVSAGGQFSASVDLNADSGIDVQADASTGVQYNLAIPASAAVQAGATAQLKSDAVTLLVPVDGFVNVDGSGTEAQVQAQATAGISSLDLNGTDLLGQLAAQTSASASASPSGSGGSQAAPAAASGPSPATASAPVPGNAKQVALTVTGSNGVSETNTVPVTQVNTLVRVGRSMSVSAFGARGLRISSVQFDTTRLARTHRLGVTVSVRDRRNYLVRDAIVTVAPTPRRTTVAGSWAATTDALGRARFSVPVSSRSARRIFVTVTAKTPRAKARLTRSVSIG
jgi:hypothetical protein